MKRILVIGCPGAGKTYFSKKLGQLLNYPVVHMDWLYWREDKTTVSREQLLEKMLPYLKEDQWIIDGNYHHTLSVRLEYATDVYFLKLSHEECVQGILERIDKKRDDIPWVETKEDAEKLIEWIKTYEERTRAEEEALLEQYQHVKVHVLSSRKEVNDYLNNLLKKQALELKLV
ncbi:MAG TPA: adenylate kinase [Erysipelotrichaceae bacterium]|nr:adenylate kinase [Erysipelotrichaceae bacterium]